MVGSGEKVPVTILRDTWAFDSFIQAGVLPLSDKSETDSSVPVRGMDSNVLLVPLHKVMLHCDLFQGEAELAVRPALPIPGVSVILENNLVGARVSTYLRLWWFSKCHWLDQNPMKMNGLFGDMRHGKGKI